MEVRAPRENGEDFRVAWVGSICAFTPCSAFARCAQVYEPGGLLTDIRARVKEFMGRHNDEFPAKKVCIKQRPERRVTRLVFLGVFVFLSCLFLPLLSFIL